MCVLCVQLLFTDLTEVYKVRHFCVCFAVRMVTGVMTNSSVVLDVDEK